MVSIESQIASDFATFLGTLISDIEISTNRALQADMIGHLPAIYVECHDVMEEHRRQGVYSAFVALTAATAVMDDPTGQGVNAVAQEARNAIQNTGLLDALNAGPFRYFAANLDGPAIRIDVDAEAEIRQIEVPVIVRFAPSRGEESV